MKVAVVGASAKPERYSYQAVMRLRAAGHTVYPVHPALRQLEGLRVYASLGEVPAPLDLVTLYLAAARQNSMAEDVIRCRPRRVIFNPGAENPALARRLRAAGIDTLEACTLVLLSTGQFTSESKTQKEI